MSRHELDLISQGPQLFANAADQLTVIAPRKVRAADGTGKQDVPDEGDRTGLVIEHHVARGMPGAVDHLQRFGTKVHHVAVLKPAIGFKGHGRLKPVAQAVVGQTVDPELVVAMRSFDGNAHACRQRRGAGTMVEVSVCQEDLLEGRTEPGQLVDNAIHVATRIDHSCLGSLLANQDGTVLRECRYRDDRDFHVDVPPSGSCSP